MQDEQPTWRSRAWLAAVLVILGLGAGIALAGFENAAAAGSVLGAAAVAVAAVIVWAALRTRAERRRYEDELAAWAAERAAGAERLRIARELHDVVSHGLGAITVRAAVARRIGGSEDDALADIERASRQATTELRRMLTVLRSPEPAPLRPAETLADLPEIVRRAVDTGPAVELVSEDLRGVSAGAQLTIVAVVREALHNVAAHAGPASAVVRIGRRPGGVAVEVVDDGPVEGWRAQGGAGRGLDGLRERLDALGGTLEAGRHGTGWRLVAVVPDEREP